MNRRSFFLRMGGVMIAVPAALQVVACGGGDDAADASLGQTSFQASNAADGSGHPHSLTILCADLARSEVTYTSGEGNDHTHQVVISGAQLASIANGDTVAVTVSTPHAHTWSVTKPATAC